MNRIEFTVVIPAYNAARTIGSAIRSVLAQTRQDFEVIVVDDGSTDGTSDRAGAYESDPRIRVIRQPNRGPSAARNAGIAAARGSYVSTLDADDLWLPEYLEVMGAALENTPGAGLAYTDAWVLDDVTGRIRRRSAMSYQRPPKVVPDPHSLFRLLLERNFIYTSVTAPRSVIERAGGYDESLWTSEDWELWLRIVATGAAAVRPPGTLAIHRKHSASLTSDPRKIARSTCEVYRRFAHDPNADADVRALAERQLAQWTKTLRDLENPTRLASLRGLAGAIKRRALSRWSWRRPPVAVERTLRAVEDGALAAP